MSAYLIFVVHSAHDKALLQKYRDEAIPVVKSQGVKFFAGPVISAALENGPVDSSVVLEFPTVEDARAWYKSPEYAPLKAMRQAAATSTTFIVESWPEGL
ncbi:DUF1330 domain-containing protein [Paraburkholderia terrae]